MFFHFILTKESAMSEIGEGRFKNNKRDNKKIEKISYNEKEQELFVNDFLYFIKVSKEVWEYKIGGYQVLDKYLKSHKNEEIDTEYFTKIIQALHKSLEIESKIAAINIFDEI
ncbi:hypothetical protein A0071_03720 [Campylobacter cuniculorum]|nr:hypothetical protein A0071_03720 [Campylobacter cuniculorum]